MTQRMMKWMAFLSVCLMCQLAFAEGEECFDDFDCAEGEECMMIPCAMPTCDPDDPECNPEDYECPEAGVCYAAFDEPWYGSCESDADCGPGWICDEMAVTTCRDVACPVGEECPSEPECSEETYNGCIPAPCESDTDCGEGLVCLTVEYDMCMGGGSVEECREGEECPPVEDEVTCESYSESFCAPAYVAPCEEDADCGEGFTCVEAEACTCTGTVSSGGEEPVTEDCDCESTGELYCEPVEIECVEDADCPEDWSCLETPSGVAVPCYYDEETGEDVCAEPEIVESESYCVPPYWGGWAASDEGYTESLDQASGGSNSRTTDKPEDQAPSNQDGSSTTEEATGCQVAPGGTGAGLSLLALFGIALVLRRRRCAGHRPTIVPTNRPQFPRLDSSSPDDA